MAHEKESPRETSTVVMGRKLAGAVRTIADRRGITMAETWERYGAPGIYVELRRVLDEMQAEVPVDPAFDSSLTESEAK